MLFCADCVTQKPKRARQTASAKAEAERAATMGGPSAAGAAGAGVASRSLPADAFSAAVAESAKAETKDGGDGKPGSARKRALLLF